MDFSVLMSIYKNTKVNEFQECINSLINQTMPSNDIVVVIDGEINLELSDFIEQIKTKHNMFNFIRLDSNKGLGIALSIGLMECKNELVARMDTDDVCKLDRFEKQIKLFGSDSKLSMVGSNIDEFVGTIDNVVSVRSVPSKHADIAQYIKSRNPFNHMTVMFKKSFVIDSGNYQDFLYNEDYFLWIRMLINKAYFANIEESLVYARIDNSTFERRGGFKYFKQQKKLFKYMRKNKIISFFKYLKVTMLRFIVQVLMPNSIRRKIYAKIARN